MPRTIRVPATARDKIIAAAVSSGRIPPAKAPAWRARLDAGTPADRGRAVAELLAHYPAGHRLPGPVAVAAATDQQVWDDLYGPGLAQPSARDADQPRRVAPIDEAGYRALFGLDGPGPARPAPMPGLAAPYAAAPVPVPSGRAVPVAASGPGRGPGWGRAAVWAGGPAHEQMDAWHSHPHTDGAGGVHDHQHVHRGDASHEVAPGHAHPEAVEVYDPDPGNDPPSSGLALPDSALPGMPAGPGGGAAASARRAPRPFRVVAGTASRGRQLLPPPPVPREVAAARVAAVLAAVRANPGVRVPWPRPGG